MKGYLIECSWRSSVASTDTHISYYWARSHAALLNKLRRLEEPYFWAGSDYKVSSGYTARRIIVDRYYVSEVEL